MNETGTSSETNINILTGGMLSNVGAFIKKNALLLGLGVLGVGGAIYLLTRKKKKSLSGISRRKRTVRKKSTKKPVRLKALGLS